MLNAIKFLSFYTSDLTNKFFLLFYYQSNNILYTYIPSYVSIQWVCVFLVVNNVLSQDHINTSIMKFDHHAEWFFENVSVEKGETRYMEQLRYVSLRVFIVPKRVSFIFRTL